MGLFDKLKKDSLNSRIKELRKEKGLTQLQLAEKLNITDKAVSKWEAGEGNPDISLLPVLAEIFDVSVDYLLTGKQQEEKIVYVSKIEMCAKKDDVKLLDEIDLRAVDETGNNLWKYILKYKCTNVFKTLVSNGKINNCIGSNGRYGNNNHYIKEIIHMCLLSNTLDKMSVFGFNDVAVAERNEWSDDALMDIVNNNVPTESVDYLLSVHSREIKDARNQVIVRNNINDYANPYTNWNWFYPFLLSKAVEGDNFQLAEKIIDVVADINKQAKAYMESRIANNADRRNSERGYRYLTRYTINQLNNYRTYGSSYTLIYAVSIDIDTVKKLLEKEKFELVDKCINLTVEGDCVSKKELELAKMKADPSYDESAICIFKYVDNNLLNINGLLNHLGNPKEDESNDAIKELKEILLNGKKLYKPIIEKYAVVPYEYLMDLFSNKDYKLIYEFAIDNKLYFIADCCLASDEKKLLDSINRTFVFTSFDDGNLRDVKIKLVRAEQYKNNRNYDYGGDYNQVVNNQKNTIIRTMMNQLRNENFDSESLYLLIEKELDFVGIVNYEKMNTNFYSFIKDKKIELFESWVKSVEDEIETRTGRRKAETEFNTAVEEITKDYLLKEIKKGHIDTAVVKMCVKLEAILRYQGYSGDLFTMMDAYEKQNMKLHNCWDDEDNNYYSYIDEDAKNQRWSDLLQKLRKKRNNLVHSDKKDVTFTEEDAIACVDIIEEIMGGKKNG